MRNHALLALLLAAAIAEKPSEPHQATEKDALPFVKMEGLHGFVEIDGEMWCVIHAQQYGDPDNVSEIVYTIINPKWPKLHQRFLCVRLDGVDTPPEPWHVATTPDLAMDFIRGMHKVESLRKTGAAALEIRNLKLQEFDGDMIVYAVDGDPVPFPGPRIRDPRDIDPIREYFAAWRKVGGKFK